MRAIEQEGRMGKRVAREKRSLKRSSNQVGSKGRLERKNFCGKSRYGQRECSKSSWGVDENKEKGSPWRSEARERSREKREKVETDARREKRGGETSVAIGLGEQGRLRKGEKGGIYEGKKRW